MMEADSEAQIMDNLLRPGQKDGANNQLGNDRHVYGTTGATNDIPDLDEPSCSSEQSSAKKTVKTAFPSHKKPKNKLIIDTEIINKMFTYGGEKGELKQEEAMEKLESDICELAAHCVAAMR